MIEKRLSPKKTLNKALLRKRLHRNEIEVFKGNLRILLDLSNELESEEFHKNLVSDFLKNTYYKNTKDTPNKYAHSADIVLTNPDC